MKLIKNDSEKEVKTETKKRADRLTFLLKMAYQSFNIISSKQTITE